MSQRIFISSVQREFAKERKALAEYVAARADDLKKDRFVVASAYVKKALTKYGKLNAVTIEEVAASCL